MGYRARHTSFSWSRIWASAKIYSWSRYHHYVYPCQELAMIQLFSPAGPAVLPCMGICFWRQKIGGSR
uniref:Uncharacterized protein n=1 Tax=Zea mays TaxID=4577 RepID=B4FE11_MAIZE|nr:unknown [Zea mays]